MPQMYPLLWLFFMIMVVTAYGLIVVANYYILQSWEVQKMSVKHQANFKYWQW